MKKITFILLIALLAIGANQAYAQSEIAIETSIDGDSVDIKKPTRYDRIWKKYRFMVEPSQNLTEQQMEMKYKMGDIVNSKTKMENGKIVSTITRKDIRQAKLPAELYYMIVQNIKTENNFLATFSAKGVEQVEESFAKVKEKYWAESKAYWESRKKTK